VIWRVFRSSRARRADVDGWWQAAEAIADSPRTEALEVLRARAGAPSSDLDEDERREEMLDGLTQLVELAAAASLPVLETQHRVIGADRCHFTAPATLLLDVSVPGKLFLTSHRAIFAGGRVQTWPWHRLRDVVRQGRDVSLVITGADALVRLQCNSFGDALIARYIALRLAKRT
jgi:hypothetical protein